MYHCTSQWRLLVGRKKKKRFEVMVCEIDGQVNGGRLHGHANSTRVNYAARILSNPSSTKPDTPS